MFNALKDMSLSSLQEHKKTRMKRGMSLRAFRAAHRQATITNKITRSLVKSGGIVNDFSDLRRLRCVAKTQGLNKALMLFVNPDNNVISRIAKNIPSNESLDAVSIGKTDRRTKAALEGMDETLAGEPKLISDWTHESADDVEQLLASVEDQLQDIGEAISHYLQTLESTDSTNEDLTGLVEAAPYDASVARIEALLEILPDMDAVISDPTDRDAMEVYKETISAMITKLGPIAGLTIDPENPHLVVSAPTAEEYAPRTGTLSELGYDTAKTIELLKKADQLVDEVNGLIERKEHMVAHLHETADTITTVDNTVPPAVDGAIVEDSDEDTASFNGGGLTQADVYHSQVASHLYCLSVIVGVSVDAVQEVLVVASELSGDDDDDDIIVIEEVTE